MMDAELQKVYRYGILAAVAPVIADYTDDMKAASRKVLNEHLDREVPDNDGLRAVAEAAWREGFAYRHGLPENDTLLSDAEFGNPYREGTP